MIRNYIRFPRTANNGYYASDVAKLYNFPTNADGSGQCVALIELGGGYKVSDLQAYASALNLPLPNVVAVGVDGATNSPGSDADGEVVLDIEMVMAIAPKAKIAVYFAPNSDQGFVDAILAAINDDVNKPSVISISWGGAEDQWNSQSIQLFEKAFDLARQKKIIVLVASGDSGADDDPNTRKRTVDYPASSDKVIACGGTEILENGQEVVWNNLRSGNGASGGGVSTLFPTPSWQVCRHPAKRCRCLPDVVGNASPLSGYKIYINGQWMIIGGTSAVAPLYAGLMVLYNQLLGKPLGYINDKLYTAPEMDYYDITVGNNGFWRARPGYDIVSGMGRIDGAKLLETLQNE